MLITQSPPQFVCARQYQIHLEKLVRKHRIHMRIVKSKNKKGRYGVRSKKPYRSIVIAEARGPITYFRTLYHIGMIVYSKCNRGCYLSKVAHAWEWSIHHSIIHMPLNVQAYMIRDLTETLIWVKDKIETQKTKPKKKIFYTLKKDSPPNDHEIAQKDSVQVTSLNFAKMLSSLDDSYDPPEKKLGEKTEIVLLFKLPPEDHIFWTLWTTGKLPWWKYRYPNAKEYVNLI